ncbi:protein kinase [Streptomyces sp. NPDC057702]|uniref:serine/threonine-protein kinase n=1 Tax=unclassified Streptomyces TaxID=2593676 RepID=UPI00367B64D4
MRPGEMVGKYRLTHGPIEGGQGTVWFARDTKLNREVVLKHGRAGEGDQAAFGELYAEARALAKFNHPHVVTLYDAVQTGPGKRATFWLVMEYVSGGSLDVPAKLAPEHVAGVGAQIADALAALHSVGLVHCDVKPGNIVITESRQAKLADFGAAYRVDSSATITPNGPISLTPAYAAPEAFRGAPERASDVFSLGATLHRLVAGTEPLRGPGNAVQLESVGPRTGPLGPLLAAMLHSDPRARPTAAAARQALTRLAGGAHDVATLPLDLPTRRDPLPSTRPQSVPGRPSRTPRPRPWVVAAGAAVAALAIAVPVLLSGLADDGGEGGTGRDEGAASAPGRTASGAPAFIGDPRTANPCALLDARAFPAYEDADIDPHQGNFNRCDVLLLERQDDVVDVRVELDADDLPEDGERHTTGRVIVVKPPPERDRCERALSVTGARASSLRITVAAREPDRVRQRLCETADIATRIAVATLNDGEVPRRAKRLDDASLAHRDACTLLDVTALAKVPGVDAHDPEAGFGDWSCQWQSTTGDVEVDLQFEQGRIPSGDETERTKVDGRQAVVIPNSAGSGTCRVEVVHRPYTGLDRKQGTERAALVVKGDDARKLRPCVLARDLARSAMESLATG